MDEATFRLPRTVIPSRYDLTLETDPDRGTFVGSEEIALRVHEPVTEVVLNANDLEVRGGWLTGADGTRIDVAKPRLDAESERAHLELQRSAEPGDWILHLDFAGTLNERLVGFYRSTYEAEDGESRVIATTHFEATDARRAFPCWDEPDLKAVFGVTLVVPDGLAALSNGPEVERERLPDGRVRVRFQDTIAMSTYLVAFVVGPLDLTPPLDVDGVPTRIAHRPGKGHLAPFALDIGAHSLRFFSDYYDIPYPDAKVDHVALPDFAAGAMENLGCITYREAALLVDPETATQQEELDIAETVAHELAHMWFGDLVTMRWWNGLWLNEAFATFMSMLAVDAYRPDWEIWNAFARFRTAALEVDALESTRSIEYPVHSPDDAQGMFDTLTYLKGGSILRMLEQYLGPDRFRDGIRRYLKHNAYGNAETTDLWDAIEEETGDPVRRIMDGWIFQGGYPAITVTIDGDTLRFAQRRYLPSGRPDDTTWAVPLLVRQSDVEGEETTALLVEDEGATLSLRSADAVVVANAGGSAFVRVWYDDDLRSRLGGAALEGLGPLERYGLVDDAWAAVTAGEATATSFCRLVEGFRGERDLPVWQVILAGLGWFDRFLEGPAREGFRDFVRGLVRPALADLGWEPSADEPDLTRSLRGQLVQAMAVLGDDPETQAQARELELAARHGEPVDPQLASAAIQVVASIGGSEEYEAFLAEIKAADTPQDELRYLYALGSFKDPALFERTLASCFTDTVRTQDAPYLLARSTTNRDLGEGAWRAIADRWDEANDRFAATTIISMVSGVRFLTTPEQQDDVAAFFETHDIPQAALMLKQTLERQRINVALRERATPDLEATFGG